MIIMTIFTIANLIVAVLGRATVLLIGRVEESSSSPHRHIRPCRHNHLGKLIIAIGNSKVEWSQPVVLLALLIK